LKIENLDLMKNKLYLLIMTVCLMVISTGVQAQLKIGYADVDYIYSKLPEAKQIESTLQAHSSQLETTLKTKIEDYQQKYQAVSQLGPDTPEAIQRDKINELQQLEQSIQQFQQEAQASLEKKRLTLLEPVYTKVGNAINAAAEEGGFDFILTAGMAGADVVLFAKEEYNISDKILNKLGVTTN